MNKVAMFSFFDELKKIAERPEMPFQRQGVRPTEVAGVSKPQPYGTTTRIQRPKNLPIPRAMTQSNKPRTPIVKRTQPSMEVPESAIVRRPRTGGLILRSLSPALGAISTFASPIKKAINAKPGQRWKAFGDELFKSSPVSPESGRELNRQLGFSNIPQA